MGDSEYSSVRIRDREFAVGKVPTCEWSVLCSPRDRIRDSFLALLFILYTANALANLPKQVKNPRVCEPVELEPISVLYNRNANGSKRLRLAEDGGLAAQTAPSRHRTRELDPHLRDGRLQPGENEKAGSRVRRSVPRGAKRALHELTIDQNRIA